MPFDGDHHRVAALKGLLTKASKVKANNPPAAYQFGIVKANVFMAANDPHYSDSEQEPPFPDHSGANKSAKNNYFLLFFTILLKRYFWHVITVLGASLLGFGVFFDIYSKGQNNHPLTPWHALGRTIHAGFQPVWPAGRAGVAWWRCLFLLLSATAGAYR